jgi:hypothetical protein
MLIVSTPICQQLFEFLCCSFIAISFKLGRRRSARHLAAPLSMNALNLNAVRQLNRATTSLPTRSMALQVRGHAIIIGAGMRWSYAYGG